MPIPRLIHPVNVRIAQISKAATVYDNDAREPVQQARRAAIKAVQGQVLWGTAKGLEVVRGGAGESADGYVLFRLVDLRAKSITLQQNDRIVQMGTVETDVYIIKLRYEGHYPDQSGPTLVKAFFADRQPSKQPKQL